MQKFKVGDVVKVTKVSQFQPYQYEMRDGLLGAIGQVTSIKDEWLRVHWIKGNDGYSDGGYYKNRFCKVPEEYAFLYLI